MRYGAIIGAFVFFCGCGRAPESPAGREVSVTNTYLESAVRDLCGEEVGVFCLAPPGMCPGHFDLAPEQVRRLLASPVVFRFDFQQSLDGALKRIKGRVAPVRGRPGMCIPETYIETCREMAPFLEGELVPLDVLDARIGRLETRLAALGEEVRGRVQESAWHGAKVLSSHRQSDFAQWLGLDVVGTFRSAEVMTPTQIEMCLSVARENDVRIVIANLQEGTELAGRMAEAVGARLVVFSNFPDTGEASQYAYDHLVRSNVDRLLGEEDM